MKRLVLVSVATASALAAWAGPLDKAVLHGETDKRRAIEYAVGEEMVFTLSLQWAGEIDPQAGYCIEWSRSGDDGKTDRGKSPLPLKSPLVIRTRIDQPGFVRIQACVKDAKGKTYQKQFLGDTSTPEGQRALNAFERSDRRVFFDGSAGAEVEKLQTAALPKDFDGFWESRLRRLAKVPLEPTVREYPSKDPKVRCFSFSVPCAGPRPATGVMTIPVDTSKKYPAFMGVHGYGARFVLEVPTSGPHDRIWTYLDAHGYDIGREPEYYDEFYESVKSNGKTFGLDSQWQNQSTNTCYFGGMIYRIARALEFIRSLPEWNGRDLTVQGGSMGGLQTIWAAGIDPKVTLANSSITWCCDMGGRESAGRIRDPWGVGETAALRYFDPVNLARRIPDTCRVNILRAGLGDYCCPPSGLSILWNNLTAPKQINWVQGSTHGYVPPEPHQRFTLFRRFFGYYRRALDDTRLMYDDGIGDTVEFCFDVQDATVHALDNAAREDILNHADCVELYFSETGDLSKPYYCIEIDPAGHIMDYTMTYPSRKQGFDWRCQSLKLQTKLIDGGYQVKGSIAKAELKSLGIDVEGRYWFGAYRADFKSDGKGGGKLVDWYSPFPYPEGPANFHLPCMFIDFSQHTQR